MSSVTFHIEGLDELKIKLARLSNPAQFRALVHGAGLLIETAFKKYPTRNSPSRASVYGTTFKSDKQRRWFFWALSGGVKQHRFLGFSWRTENHNLIDVPYRRGQSPGSRNLQQSWTTRMISDTAVEIGTNVPYAGLVMDAERQSKYMAAVGWRTVNVLLNEVEPQVKDALESGISKILGV